jgi:signal transduction histidine kinase
MAQASHELKTPLAIIEASLETLEDPTLSESERQALRASLHEEAQRMNALINRLLESVRAQVKDVALQWTQVEVRALTEKIAHDLGLKMHLTGPPAVPLLSDASLMHSLVSNLLRNAKDHRLKETEVRVTISDDPVFSWRCENLTPPLTLDPASLLRPFVKGNTASQGHGLGLSIVQDLAVRLGLKLELTVQNQHFSVTLTQPHKNR